jgi:hypothetical protein
VQFAYGHRRKYFFTINFDFCYSLVKHIQQSLNIKSNRNTKRLGGIEIGGNDAGILKIMPISFHITGLFHIVAGLKYHDLTISLHLTRKFQITQSMKRAILLHQIN